MNQPTGPKRRHARSLFAPVLAVGLIAGVAGCGGRKAEPPVKDLEFTQSMSSARLAFERGQVPQAVLLYEQALRRATARDDAADIGEAAYNLGVCLFDAGQLDRAGPALETARLELARAGQRTNDVQLVQAKLARRKGGASSTEAAAIAERVAAAKDATAAERCEALTLLGEIDLEAGRLDAARQRLAEARRALPTSGVSPRSRDAMTAGVIGIEAKLATADGNHAAAAAAYDRQAQLYQSAGLFNPMGRSLLAAGRAYRTAGNPGSAADRLFRAARSLLAQVDNATGMTAAIEAVEAAKAAGDPAMTERASSLMQGAPTTQP